MADRSPSAFAGKRVVLTRAESQSAALVEALRAKGAEIISLPVIRIALPQDFNPLDSALRDMANFDWLIFTSQNAVTAVADRLSSLAMSGSERLRSLRIAAVGKSTAHSAVAAGFSVAHTGKGTAADLVQELTNDLRGKRVFLPRSDRAAAALITQLHDLGAHVTEAVAYRTIALDTVDKNTTKSIADADVILFFSPSAVSAFLQLVKSGVLPSLREDAAVGAIGPVTHSALGDAGLRCDFQAAEPSVNEIIAALTAYFEKARVSSVSGVNSQ